MDNPFLIKANNFLSKNPINTHKDQFFLIDSFVIKKLIEVADINSRDKVLEVGPGLGFLTEKLAQKAKEVIAVEIDKRFKPYLDNLSNNVKVIYGDAYRLLNDDNFRQKIMPITKSVSCIPSNSSEISLLSSTKHYFGNNLFQTDS